MSAEKRDLILLGENRSLSILELKRLNKDASVNMKRKIVYKQLSVLRYPAQDLAVLLQEWVYSSNCEPEWLMPSA